MKRNLYIISFLLSLVLFLVSCKPSITENKSNNQYLLKGEYQIKSYITLTNVLELEKMIIDKENFILFVGNPECGACIAFEPIYIQTAKNNNLKLYYILSSNELYDSKLFSYKYTPTLVLFQNGEVAKLIDPTTDSKPFQNSANLLNFIKEYYSLPIFIEINIDQLDQLIASNKKFVIYFSWNKCSDCASLNTNLLINYQLNHQDVKDFYTIEVDEYRSGGASSDVWKNFASKYKFDNYRGGKVPTLQYRNGDNVEAMVVYYNDTIEQVKDDVGTVIAYKITGSYYQDAPFINKSYPSYNPDLLEDITPFHILKVETFLNQSWKKING